jgi:hypothetical protein
MASTPAYKLIDHAYDPIILSKPSLSRLSVEGRRRGALRVSA